MTELRESEARHRIVMETVSDAIIAIDEAGVIRFINAAAGKIFGYPVEELHGKPLTMLMPEYMRRLHETGRRHISWEGVELPGLRRSGREIKLEISFGEFTQNGNKYFTGVARSLIGLGIELQDITTRKTLQNGLAYALEKLRDQSNVGAA